ncbi:VOC family protein [Marinoscillum pacificum]|uniref:VOC family protein n=1 Tax=Marinoscillum pacificum TaxID=392723 RepID=UPI002157B2BC|nr:VOC family protein [Marinoscillum pacificum]
MRFEHFALNVEAPIKMAQWYCEHLGLHLVFEQDEPPYMRFLADETDQVVMELYQNPNAPITNHSKNHHLVFHMAFESRNAESDKQRLLAAGASFVEEKGPDQGTHLVMLRDPWGIPLQVCQRKNRLNKN